MLRSAFLIITVGTLLIASCSSPVATDKVKTVDTIPEYAADPQTIGDTFKVYGPSMIFMWPDSIQAEQMKSKDSDAFYTAADDYSFYNSELMNTADSLKIKNFSTSAKFIDFAFAGSHLLVDRSATEDLWWNLYLFNGIDTPKLQSTVDINSIYLQKFFKQ